MKCAIFEEHSSSCVVYFRFSGTLFPVSMLDGENTYIRKVFCCPFGPLIGIHLCKCLLAVLYLRHVPSYKTYIGSNIIPFTIKKSRIRTAQIHSLCKYTETIKLCPLDVYVCQFQMYERISFKFSHYQLLSFSNGLHLRDIHLIIGRTADKATNTSTLKIKSHNINSLCVRHNPEPFKHI